MLWTPLTYLLLSILAPGPVALLTVCATLRRGRQAGLAVAAGSGLATALFVALAALAFAQTSSTITFQPPQLTLPLQIAWMGGVVLLSLVLGYRCLSAFSDPAPHAQPTRHVWTYAAVAFGLMALLLPKALTFYTIILPYHAPTGQLGNAILLLGGLHIAGTLGWYGALTYLATSLQRWATSQYLPRSVELFVAFFLVDMSITLLAR